MLARYRREYVEVGVDPEPVARTDEVVAVEEYPYEVANEYGADTAVPTPPDSVARIPNCSVPGVEEAAVPPIALMVFVAFCWEVRV
jgi:hypothetical protein